MEALSEKDVNARAQVKQAMQKPKAAPAKALTREKDHPPTPPSEILEPSSSDRPSGSIYYTGRLLGKGGFAICHEAQLSGTRMKYALKVVKSRMPQKKMEQKVFLRPHLPGGSEADILIVSNRTPNSFQDETCEYCTIPPSFLFRTKHIYSPGAVSQRIFDGYG